MSTFFVDRQLSEEIERLQRKASTNDDMFVVEQVSGSQTSSEGGTKKRMASRKNILQEGGEHEHTSLDGSENGLDKENTFSGPFYNTNQDRNQHCNENLQQPRCCRRRPAGSGMY